MTQKQKQNKFYLYLLAGIIVALGLITLINAILVGSLKYTLFLSDFFEKTFYSHYAYATVEYKRPVAEVKEWEVVETYKGKVTKYNAGDPNQCDNTPCIAANGENICTAVALGYGRCATNKYDFGTILRIDGFICTVVDRMNSRYQNGEVDIAMPADKKQEAINYGASIKTIEVLK